MPACVFSFRFIANYCNIFKMTNPIDTYPVMAKIALPGAKINSYQGVSVTERERAYSKALKLLRSVRIYVRTLYTNNLLTGEQNIYHSRSLRRRTKLKFKL